LARARRLADLAEAPWVYTGASSDSGYAKVLYERHGLKPPPAGALVNSTLGLLSILASGNCVGLMPQQIAVHPVAARKPSVRHFLAHLHRAAHHFISTGG